MDRGLLATEFAELYSNFKASKMKHREAFKKIRQLGFKKSWRTLYRHSASVQSTGHALSPVKKNYSHPLLNEDQMKIVNDWVLEQNVNNIAIGYSDAQRFIFKNLSITMCKRTAGNVLHRLGHTLKTCQTKNGGFTKTRDELEAEYWQFILKLKKENTINRYPQDIRSIDVTYTRRPSNSVTTFSPKGEGKQKSDVEKHSYTNAIVTMVSGDGKNHTPCLMFTNDPKMKIWPKMTARRQIIHEAFKAACKRYNIKEDRIIFEDGKSKYFAECPEVYTRFLTHYKVPKNVVILHDGGTAFKEKETSIFEKLGYKHHVTYPADVHQWLSPNDNNLHGCKSKWYEEYYKFDDGVEASLRLMNLIDLETIENSKMYFNRNVLNVKKRGIAEVMRS